jgi:hypothetical protein
MDHFPVKSDRQKEVKMIDRRAFCIAAILTCGLSASSANSAEKAGWDGTWVGDFGKTSRISITVAHNKVTGYSYRGEPLDVSYDKIADDKLSFGDGYNYAMSLKRTGDNTATATYHGRHGFAAAALRRQPALVSNVSH